MDSEQTTHSRRTQQAALCLNDAIEAEKCHTCGNMHTVVLMLEDELPGGLPGGELARALEAGRAVLKQVETDCRDCEPCLSMGALMAARMKNN